MWITGCLVIGKGQSWEIRKAKGVGKREGHRKRKIDKETWEMGNISNRTGNRNDNRQGNRGKAKGRRE